jgi:membrane-bound lytic murein transglycosylase
MLPVWLSLVGGAAMTTDHNYRFVRILVDRGESERGRVSMDRLVQFLQAFRGIDVLMAEDQNSFDFKRANVDP